MTRTPLRAYLKVALEFLGGAVDHPGEGVPRMLAHPVVLGAWWALLVLLILTCAGQASKFIYIDF